MASEILTVGDELLRGDIVDTNSSYLADRLFDLGLPVVRSTSVGDELPGLIETLRECGDRANVVIVSGGLGPTEDDRTAEAAAKAAGVGRKTHEPSLEVMRERFERIGYEMTPNNKRQALLPEGAQALPNAVGTAPGFTMKIGKAQFFFLPGVPRELRRMLRDEVAPRIAPLGKKRHVRTLRVFRMGESHIDHKLRDVNLGDVALHYQAKFPENLLRLVSEDEAAIDRAESSIREKLGDVIYASGNETLPKRVGRALREKSATVAIAESCTGGLIGHLLTEVPGSSDYFVLGTVVYSNDFKQKLLGVSAKTLEHHGAVSEACVREMADGIRRYADATFGVGVSGIAGPGGGTDEKPVGTIFLGVSRADGCAVRKIFFPGKREQVKTLAAHGALAMLLRACEGPPELEQTSV